MSDKFLTVMQRPSFQSIYLTLAKSLSMRSTCRRLQVGCVIASPDFRRVYAVGYNGNYSGGPNDCDRYGLEAVGNCGCIHAEANAVANLDVARQLEKVVFVTHLPCVPCAKLLIQIGSVRHVVYANEYRDKTSLSILESVGIETSHAAR